REVPACGVADSNYAFRVEMIFWGMGSKCIGGSGDVEEGPRIPAARPIYPPIIDVPDRDSAASQVIGNPIHQVAVGDIGLPTAAMDHQHRGEGAVPPWKPEIDH